MKWYKNGLGILLWLFYVRNETIQCRIAFFYGLNCLYRDSFKHCLLVINPPILNLNPHLLGLKWNPSIWTKPSVPFNTTQLPFKPAAFSWADHHIQPCFSILKKWKCFPPLVLSSIAGSDLSSFEFEVERQCKLYSFRCVDVSDIASGKH